MDKLLRASIFCAGLELHVHLEIQVMPHVVLLLCVLYETCSQILTNRKQLIGNNTFFRLSVE